MHSRLWAHSPLSLSHTLNSVCAADRARAICDLEIPALVCWLPWGSRVDVTCERWPGASECVSTPTRGYAYVLRVRTSRVQCVRVGPSRAGSGESASEADCARATDRATARRRAVRVRGVRWGVLLASRHADLAAHRSSRPVALSYVLERRVNEAARASRLSRALLSESLSLSLSRSLVPLSPAPTSDPRLSPSQYICRPRVPS